MNDYFQEVLTKYKNKGILIDTNILLLWIVGTVNRKRIASFKRTQQFVIEDFDLLLGIIAYFNQVITTPNIMTEVNSLINQLGEPERSQALAIFAQGISSLNEIYLESQEIVKEEVFIKFGLTDCGILKISPHQCLVLTDDLKLAHYLMNKGIDAINFNNIRVYGWR
jgi:rRNA-processing protein FCF1